MRKSPTKRIEQYRTAGNPEWGAIGFFEIPHPSGALIRVMASDGSEWEKTGMPFPAWEHVSVSMLSRTPTWEEMDWVKRIFWSDDELVLQFHVPRSDHINFHQHCLHLWKPIGVTIPTPPLHTVAPSSYAGEGA